MSRPTIRKTRDGYPVQTYCIVDNDGHCKIGLASHPFSRLKELQTGNPHILRIHGLIRGDHEARLHAQYTHVHKRGEWFHASADLLAEFTPIVFGTIEWRSMVERNLSVDDVLHACAQGTHPYTRAVCGRRGTYGWEENQAITIRCAYCLTILDIPITAEEREAQRHGTPRRPRRWATPSR